MTLHQSLNSEVHDHIENGHKLKDHWLIFFDGRWQALTDEPCLLHPVAGYPLLKPEPAVKLL